MIGLTSINSDTVVEKKYRLEYTVFWLLFLRLILDIGYVYFVAEFYGYDGFTIEIDKMKLFESYILLLIISMLLPRKGNKPSVILLYLFVILVITPLLSLYGLADKERWMLYVLLSGYFIVQLVTHAQLRISVNVVTIRWMNVACISSILLVTFAFFVNTIVTGGWRYFNLDLTKIYQFRDDVGLTIYAGSWAYITNWLVKVFNLALAAWFLHKCKYLAFAGCLLLQVIYFGLTSHKSTLFAIVLVIGFYVLFKKGNPIKFIVLSIVITLLFSLILAVYFDSVFVASMFIRRVFFVPANLSFVYLDFFSNNPHVYMSNSILKLFYSYPYDVTTSRLIGAYLGKPEMGANNGFLASGYMHFGVFGVIGFSFIVGLILWVVDIISTRLPVWLCLSVVIGPIVGLFTSSDLGTSLLTHGLLLALLTLYLLSSREQKITYK